MKEQPTGPSLRVGTVGPGELVAKNIEEFMDAGGSAWVLMKMR
jgi:hypothetical protein